ncbi:hypothetical protein HK100_012250 [Physocladia obscura]|uniref:Uncharacterized protein n=1 Tax=Physocladia obscura TaxID=109957 RepID=A0AAD5TAU2_9FUNG|nr:hypothetical protein HK100_012250 [Physocladia obscura]
MRKTSYFEQKKASSTSALEITTLRAKISLPNDQKEQLLKENTSKNKIAIMNVDQSKAIYKLRQNYDERIATAAAVAEMEKVRREPI